MTWGKVVGMVWWGIGMTVEKADGGKVVGEG